MTFENNVSSYYYCKANSNLWQHFIIYSSSSAGNYKVLPTQYQISFPHTHTKSLEVRDNLPIVQVRT